MELAAQAASAGNVPIIIHYPPDPLPLSILLLEKLRPGDILTHCFANLPPTEPIVNLDTGVVQDFAFEARERCVLRLVSYSAKPCLKNASRTKIYDADTACLLEKLRRAIY